MTMAVEIEPGKAVSLEQRELIEGLALAYLEDSQDANPNPYSISKAIGVNHMTFYRLMEQHKGFGARIRQAIAIAGRIANDAVEDVMYARALSPTNPTGVTAGIFLLKSNRRQQYGDRFTGTGPTINVSIDKAQINLAGESTDEMRELEEPPES